MSSDPAQDFATILHNVTCPANDVPPMTEPELAEALSRLPAPNKAQGSSGLASEARPDQAHQFAEALEEGLTRGWRRR